jgi:hypothetical protein
MTEVDMFLLSTPETLATAAADLTEIREAVNGANAAAAAPISGVLAAADDEVSTAIANAMSLYGSQYQAAAEQAATFHARFSEALAAVARWYADAEAANASLVAGFSQSAAADPLTALIMGGTDPLPSTWRPSMPPTFSPAFRVHCLKGCSRPSNSGPSPQT